MDNMNDMNKDTMNDTKKQMEQKAEGLADKIGGAMEKLGHKISEAGAPGIGQKIHDLGDKMETTHENPSHPHDV